MTNVQIGTHNTWNEWHLLLVSHNTGTRDVYTEYREVECIDGIIDNTETLTNAVKYGLRVVSFTFRAMPKLTHENWMDTYYKLLEEVHGKKLNVVFDGKTYNGRCAITEITLKDTVSDITIEVEG